MSPRVVHASFLLLISVALSALDAQASAQPAPTPEGRWETPGGILEIRLRKERAGGVLGGQLVLDGTFFEDNLMAEVRLGVVAPGCEATETKAFVLLLLTKTDKLTGGLSTDEPCAKDVTSLTFRRSESASTPVVSARSTASDVQAEALLHEGLALMQVGRFERARDVFERAVETAPTRGEAYNGVGVTYAMRGEWREAIDWYKRGLEAQPAFADLYYNLACAYARLDMASMALRYLRLSALKGWAQPELMESDPDLASVRDLDDFSLIVSLVPSAPDKVAP